MIRYLIRRILWAMVLFLAVTIVAYVIFFIIPVDPARLAAGQRATNDEIQRARHFLGLDKPVYHQYARFLGRLVGVHYVDHGGTLGHIDFQAPSLGRSFTNRQDVTRNVIEGAPVTASLVFGGAILWLLIALPVGILAALRPRSLLDRSAMVFVLLGISFPVVWIGLELQYMFGYKWPIFPNAGYCDVFYPAATATCGGPVQWAYHMILPWTTFALLFAAIYVRMIRANVMDTMNEDYVRTARAKGAPEPQVMRKHILRNALLPVVTMLGMDIGLGLGGAIFTESIFGLRGLGRLSVQAIANFDLPTIQGVVVFSTICIIVFNLIIDILYAYIDPRIRLA